MIDKRDYRTFMRAHRRDYVLSQPETARQATEAITRIVLELIKNDFPLENNPRIAGYWTMGQEVDALPIMRALLKKGYKLLLPKARGTDTNLSFCEWNDDVEMEESDLGFLYPTSPPIKYIPNLVVVPLVAFDRRGYRLGYGKGHYDKTLDILRQKDPTVQTLGLAYSIQQVDELPTEAHDIKLDCVATEEGIIRFT